MGGKETAIVTFAGGGGNPVYYSVSGKGKGALIADAVKVRSNVVWEPLYENIGAEPVEPLRPDGANEGGVGDIESDLDDEGAPDEILEDVGQTRTI